LNSVLISIGHYVLFLTLLPCVVFCCLQNQPTVGPPISLDVDEEEWGKNIEMKDFRDGNGSRDVRKEIEESLDKFVEEPFGGRRVDRSDQSQDEELKQLLRSMQDKSYNGPYAIEDDDDLGTIYAKLTASDEDFQLF